MKVSCKLHDTSPKDCSIQVLTVSYITIPCHPKEINKYFLMSLSIHSTFKFPYLSPIKALKVLMNQDPIMIHELHDYYESFLLNQNAPHLSFFLSMTFTFRKDKVKCLTECPSSGFVQLFPNGTI